MKSFRALSCILAIALAAAPLLLRAATPDDSALWSQHFANSAIARWPNGRIVAGRIAQPGAPSIWNYELGTLLEGMDSVWLSTADPSYFNYIQKSVDALLAPDGSIPTLKPEEHQLDNILLGLSLIHI